MNEEMTPDKADFRARCFVNGVRKHSVSGKVEPAGGEFAERFLSHPWVREAVTQGWGAELRTALIHTVKRRIMAKLPHDNVSDLMPDKAWVDEAKRNADRYRLAAEWRVQKYGEVGDVTRMLERLGVKLGDRA